MPLYLIDHHGHRLMVYARRSSSAVNHYLDMVKDSLEVSTLTPIEAAVQSRYGVGVYTVGKDGLDTVMEDDPPEIRARRRRALAEMTRLDEEIEGAISAAEPIPYADAAEVESEIADPPQEIIDAVEEAMEDGLADRDSYIPQPAEAVMPGSPSEQDRVETAMRDERMPWDADLSEDEHFLHSGLAAQANAPYMGEEEDETDGDPRST